MGALFVITSHSNTTYCVNILTTAHDEPWFFLAIHIIDKRPRGWFRALFVITSHFYTPCYVKQAAHPCMGWAACRQRSKCVSCDHSFQKPACKGIPKRRLQKQPRDIDRPKVPMPRFVAKGGHAKQSTCRAAKEAQPQEHRLGRAPFSAFCTAFIDTVSEKRDQAHGGVDQKQVVFHVHF